ncbi:MAG: hypothetical protein CMB99_09390 [Flavobacteriaceae bacterium]|nr:hypothetical protein [Flavobacteriaceae bacterium]
MQRKSNFRYSFLILFLSFQFQQTTGQIVKGADVGWLSYFEDNLNITYVNDQGQTQDALQILKDHEMSAIRLRAFVNPTLQNIGNVTTQDVVQTAVRAKNLGMDVMITIHYSDVWADPGSQHKPVAWENLSFNDLAQAVYDYTYGLMDALLNAGVTPKWVQVGNETNPGFLWEDGRLSSNDNFANMSNYVTLSNKGYDAIKARSSSTKVITHLSSGNSTSFYQQFFDAFYAAGGKNDIIGASFYPRWNGSDIQAVEANLNNLVTRYDKDVMICEIGHLEGEREVTYNLLVDAIDAVEAIPNNRGLGVFYWEPISHTSINGYEQGLAEPIDEKEYQFSWALDGFLSSAQNCTETAFVSSVKVDDGSWEEITAIVGYLGGKVQIKPSAGIGGTWKWRGPNGFRSTDSEIELTDLQASDAGTYRVTYTPTSGCPADLEFILQVLQAGQIFVDNSGFEDGVVAPWAGVGNFGVDTDLINSGTYSGWFGGGVSELSQTLSGLKPNTSYQYACYIRNWSGDSGVVTVGVKDFGGTEVTTTVGMTGNNGNDFELAKVTFTTGNSANTAVIYASTTNSQTWGKIDDASVFETAALSVTSNTIDDVISFQMYPNPATNKITIIPPEQTTTFGLQLFTIRGKSVFKGSYDVSTQRKITISVGQLVPGTYFVKLSEANSIPRYQKLIID